MKDIAGQQTPDFLDAFIAEEVERDPAFAIAWSRAEQRLGFAEVRKQAGLTQAAVAAAMGVRQPRVAEIEADPTKVAFGTMLKYAEAVGAQFILTPQPAGRKKSRR